MWFDDSDAEEKMLEFILRLTPSYEPESDDDDDEEDGVPPNTSLSQDTTSFLDLGCGNGSILFALRRAGFNGPLHGVDYSPQSVALARQIADAEDELKDVVFSQWDLLNDDVSVALGSQGQGYDVLLDKGTFDAISLSAATNDDGKRIMEGYRPRALSLVKNGGLFLITSCNWTEDELKGWFVNVEDESNGKFDVVGRVKYRTFSFGGVKGQTISTLCLRKSA